MPATKGRPQHIHICLQERFYFGDTVLPLFESGIPLVRERMKALPDADNITIAYPDEGAWKRFHYQFGDYPEASPISSHPIYSWFTPGVERAQPVFCVFLPLVHR